MTDAQNERAYPPIAIVGIGMYMYIYVHECEHLKGCTAFVVLSTVRCTGFLLLNPLLFWITFALHYGICLHTTRYPSTNHRIIPETIR